MLIIKILLVILAILIVGSIMLQQGKGSDLGSAFGGGSSDSLFGPLGPSNFLSKLTWILAQQYGPFYMRMARSRFQ